MSFLGSIVMLKEFPPTICACLDLLDPSGRASAYLMQMRRRCNAGVHESDSVSVRGESSKDSHSRI
jgi:hypothetical protein